MRASPRSPARSWRASRNARNSRRFTSPSATMDRSFTTEICSVRRDFMAFTQANRPLKLTTPLGADKLLLVSYQGREAISQMFRFDLQTVWTDRNQLLPFHELLGKKITIEISPSVNKRFINGMVSRITQGVKDENFVHYTLEIVPMCWLLDRKLNSRAFQQKTIPEILKLVFQGIDVDYKIDGTFEKREY